MSDLKTFLKPGHPEWTHITLSEGFNTNPKEKENNYFITCKDGKKRYMGKPCILY